jgi:hypothetical protein
MTSRWMQLCWISVVMLGIPLACLIPEGGGLFSPHIVWSAGVILSTGMAIAGFRWLGKEQLATEYWCVLLGFAGGVIGMLVRS